MANLRPATRLFTRALLTARPATIRATAASAPRALNLNTSFSLTSYRYKSDNSSISPENRPVAVPGPDSDQTVSKADSGAYSKTPGEPTSPLSSGISPTKTYSFEEMQSLSSSPSSTKIIIDVREPSEVLGTGRIPGSKNLPISSSPDSFFMNAEDFEDKFGWERPGEDVEVVFYCKAGVRSNAAARLAGQAGFGGKIGEYPGSWVDWAAKGGKIERAD